MKTEVTSDLSLCVSTENGSVESFVYVCVYTHIHIQRQIHTPTYASSASSADCLEAQAKPISFLSCPVTYSLNMEQNLLIFFYISQK